MWSWEARHFPLIAIFIVLVNCPFTSVFSTRPSVTPGSIFVLTMSTNISWVINMCFTCIISLTSPVNPEEALLFFFLQVRILRLRHRHKARYWGGRIVALTSVLNQYFLINGGKRPGMIPATGFRETPCKPRMVVMQQWQERSQRTEGGFKDAISPLSPGQSQPVPSWSGWGSGGILKEHPKRDYFNQSE